MQAFFLFPTYQLFQKSIGIGKLVFQPLSSVSWTCKSLHTSFAFIEIKT